jgi:hypothetical protein
MMYGNIIIRETVTMTYTEPPGHGNLCVASQYRIAHLRYGGLKLFEDKLRSITNTLFKLLSRY